MNAAVPSTPEKRPYLKILGPGHQEAPPNPYGIVAIHFYPPDSEPFREGDLDAFFAGPVARLHDIYSRPEERVAVVPDINGD